MDRPTAKLYATLIVTPVFALVAAAATTCQTKGTSNRASSGRGGRGITPPVTGLFEPREVTEVDLQDCLDRAKRPPEQSDRLFTPKLVDHRCEELFDDASRNFMLSGGARAAFGELRDRVHTLRRRRDDVLDLSREEVELLARPRTHAAYRLDPFMPEIQRIAPSDRHPEAAPTRSTPLR